MHHITTCLHVSKSLVVTRIHQYMLHLHALNSHKFLSSAFYWLSHSTKHSRCTREHQWLLPPALLAGFSCCSLDSLQNITV
jgi:hypothetical protein